MRREILGNLLIWKNKKNKKPLILNGARQTGKTYILKYLGENHFTSYHYFNFEKGGKLHQIFDKDLDPSRILGELSLLQERAIDKEDLIIFDEIQNCPRPSQA